MCCRNKKENEETATPRTPVTVAEVTKESISENITLNAGSVYLKKHTIKVFIAGYVNKVNVVVGQKVHKGEVLFTLTTKEAAAYNSLDIKDSSFIRPKDLVITATADGMVSSVAHQNGEYAQEGDELCTIADPNSIVFILELPYELHQYAKINESCIVKLPDGKELQGSISALMPKVDNTAQTQNIIIKSRGASEVPENLVVSVILIKSVKADALVVPKEAVLSNETESEFWTMKLINDSVAIKTPVKTGIKNREKIELLQSGLSSGDRVLLSGNYGLPDTAKVKVVNGNTSAE